MGLFSGNILLDDPLPWYRKRERIARGLALVLVDARAHGREVGASGQRVPYYVHRLPDPIRVEWLRSYTAGRISWRRHRRTLAFRARRA